MKNEVGGLTVRVRQSAQPNDMTISAPGQHSHEEGAAVLEAPLAKEPKQQL